MCERGKLDTDVCKILDDRLTGEVRVERLVRGNVVLAVCLPVTPNTSIL
jgi:hypothetical protein